MHDIARKFLDNAAYCLDLIHTDTLGEDCRSNLEKAKTHVEHAFNSLSEVPVLMDNYQSLPIGKAENIQREGGEIVFVLARNKDGENDQRTTD